VRGPAARGPRCMNPAKGRGHVQRSVFPKYFSSYLVWDILLTLRGKGAHSVSLEAAAGELQPNEA